MSAAEQMGKAIIGAVVKVTSTWARHRKAEERDRSSAQRRRERLLRSRQVSVKDAAFEIMERAYLAASANNTLPATARQVMYAARREIQARTGKQLNDQYFTQTLLPDYIAETGVEWDVVFDDRGHFTEPHTGREVGLGTLAVREYLDASREPVVVDAALRDAAVLTSGPANNFGAVLFVEKEGFMPFFQHVNLAERFDIAIMSSKGMPSTAARRLVETLCGERGVPLFVLHDFDKAGMSIASVLSRDTRRYQFGGQIEVIDIGLRLIDVLAERLTQAAEAIYDRGDIEARRANLELNGATEAEIKFPLERRVELNALTSDQLVRYIERKLAAHGVAKVVPDDAMLGDAYRAFIRGERARSIVEKALAEAASGAAIEMPTGLKDQVEEYLRTHPTARWDRAIAAIVGRKS
jgi:hypothetical protein